MYQVIFFYSLRSNLIFYVVGGKILAICVGYTMEWENHRKYREYDKI